MGDKIKFGLKNVHVFPIIDDTPIYDKVIPVPGAVNLTLNSQGEISKFYADDITYYQTSSNNGYDGDLEIALIPDAMWEKIYNYLKDTDNVLTENASRNVVPFGMTFEESGDVSGTKFVLYNCTTTRPNRSLATKGETIEPTTQTVHISAAPLKDGNVMSMTRVDTTVKVLQEWHNSIYGYNKSEATD